MGAVITEAGRPSDWLVFEENGMGRYSREQGILAQNQDLPSGAVLGKDADGKLRVYDDETVTDAGGAQAVGILVYATKTGSGETKKVAYIARHARVATAQLQWKSGLGSTPKTNGINDLAALGIVDATAV